MRLVSALSFDEADKDHGTPHASENRAHSPFLLFVSRARPEGRARRAARSSPSELGRPSRVCVSLRLAATESRFVSHNVLYRHVSLHVESVWCVWPVMSHCGQPTERGPRRNPNYTILAVSDITCLCFGLCCLVPAGWGWCNLHRGRFSANCHCVGGYNRTVSS